jgi:hypothetical protein
MGLKVTVNRSVVVGGKTYASIEEVPDNIRRAVTEALARRAQAGEGAEPPAKITVNGQEYASREEMPEEVRRIYDGAMATIGRGDAFAASGPPASRAPSLPADAFDSARPIEPAAPGSRSALRAFVLGLVVLLALLGAYAYFSWKPGP